MKHVLCSAALALGFFASGVSELHAQAFTIAPKEHSVQWDYKSDLILKSLITNNSLGDLKLQYNVLAMEIPEPWRQELNLQFCDMQNCFPLSAFSQGMTRKGTLSAAMGTTVMQLDFLFTDPDNPNPVTPGKARFILAFGVDGQELTDTLRFEVNYAAGSVQEEQADLSGFGLTAQGADFVQLALPAGITQISLFNASGIQLQQYRPELQQLQINTSGLSSGIYFIRATDMNGRYKVLPFNQMR